MIQQTRDDTLLNEVLIIQFLVLKLLVPPKRRRGAFT